MATTTLQSTNLRTISAANILLGAWLFLSAFLWTHTEAQFTNAWLVGLVVAGAAAAALRYPAARFVNTVMGAWLFLSVWFLSTANDSTMWNHLIVGAAVFIVSLLPGVSARTHTAERAV